MCAAAQDALAAKTPHLVKTPSGIKGLDEIMNGGLPKGRPTLVVGNAGSGKTLLGLEFLVRGALDFDEPGVFVSFEETPEELAENVTSLGFRLDELLAQRKLHIDHIRSERAEITETGEFDLEGLFIRIDAAIKAVGAQRVVLDTIEVLFASLTNHAIVRAELRRLLRWLKERGITAVITGERGEKGLTRHGIEEYVADCVIVLDHRVMKQISTRRIRVAKYRGSQHGTNEYPFLIGPRGLNILPVTSIELAHQAFAERVSSGIAGLDDMLGGEGYYRGSSVLISGSAGSGKTSVAAHFVDSACRRGERAIFFAFEESPDQLVRNMRSIGIDLSEWMRRDLLRVIASRPPILGLESHLVTMQRYVEEFKPRVVVIDPLSNFGIAGAGYEVRLMLERLVDYMKSASVTAVFTDLTHGSKIHELASEQVSSLIDTWILLRSVESIGERNGCVYVLKSRGMAHSNQMREFVMTSHGIKLVDVYLGPTGILTRSARLAQEDRERHTAEILRRTTDERQKRLEQERKLLEAHIQALRLEFEGREASLERSISRQRERLESAAQGRAMLQQRRQGRIEEAARS